MSTLNDAMTKLGLFRFDPGNIQRTALDALEEAYEGAYDLTDPTNPFIFLLEASAVQAASAGIQNDIALRKLYPTLAESEEDLYRHMADEDYIGRFALPSTATFSLLFSKEELIAQAVATGNAGVRLITIPRNTVFVVSETYFGIHYPINIRVLENDAIQVLYDTSLESPLETLATNVVDHETVTIEGFDYLRINVDVAQFKLTPKYFATTVSTSLTQQFTFTNQFYYARVWMGDGQGNYTEIHTTHSDQVFASDSVTALLRVADQTLTVTIPEIYYTNGLLQSNIRVDIYTTLGELDLILGNYPTSEYAVEWRDIDNVANAPWVAPLGSLSNVSIFSEDTTRNGRGGLTVDELKQRVIYNDNRQDVPITDTALSTTLSDLGYKVVKRLDNVTDRIYQATRLLPSPNLSTLTSPIGALTRTIQVNMGELATLNTCYDNGLRLTIGPNTLYRLEDGLLKYLPSDEQAVYESLAADSLISAMNNNTFLYTPFHYVLDTTENAFDCRPYYLDNPSIVTRRFYEDNNLITQQASTSALSFERVESGYRLLVTVETKDLGDDVDISQLIVQLGFNPPGDVNLSVQHGEFIGYSDDLPVYSFMITTNFDVTVEDRIAMTGFKQYHEDLQVYYIDLESELTLTYILTDTDATTQEVNAFKGQINANLIDGGYVGLLQEGITFKFGTAMSLLRSDSRSIVSSLKYATYDEPVYVTYADDVYETDAYGARTYEVDDEGNVTFNKLHSKGDLVLKDDEPIVRHQAGETILDNNGNPIIANERTINNVITLVCFDAKYRYATSDDVVNYRKSIPDTIIEYLEEDIASLDGLLLERTDISFAPRQTLGDLTITVSDNISQTIPAAQAFVVTYYMTADGNGDNDLRNAIERQTRALIAEALDSDTVTTLGIERALLTAGGSEVVSVSIDGLGPDNNIDAYTVLDANGVSTIANRLSLSTDGTLTVVDDITINFILHQ